MKHTLRRSALVWPGSSPTKVRATTAYLRQAVVPLARRPATRARSRNFRQRVADAKAAWRPPRRVSGPGCPRSMESGSYRKDSAGSAQRRPSVPLLVRRERVRGVGDELLAEDGLDQCPETGLVEVALGLDALLGEGRAVQP